MHVRPLSGRRGRTGYTLLEVTLALAIAVFLLAALYVALKVQLRHAEAGREVVEQGTLARALLTRIGNDISASVNLCDPARYRRTSSSGSSSTSGSSSSAGGMTGTSAGSSSGTSGTAGSSTSGSGSSDSSASSSSTSTSSNSVLIPPGVQGDSSQLTLYVSKVPRELFWSTNTSGAVVSDLRRITYWMAGGGTGGLARQEVTLITAPGATDLTPPLVGDESSYVIAPEVQSLSFSYFDGTSWQDSWDSTALGADGVTPVGPPRAIAIIIGIAAPSPSGSPTAGGPVKLHRHVVAIQPANGATQQTTQQTNQQTNQQTTGGGTSP